jgi:hypothetical protein
MSAKKSVEEKKQSARLWRQRNEEYLKEWKRKWYEKNYKNNPEYKAHRKKICKRKFS